MIVNRLEDGFVLITQHHHALASGTMVRNWKEKYLIRSKVREEADWAVAEHDRAWIPLDRHPLWNERKEQPFTFVDYPLKEKLAAYKRGIDEVEQRSAYAAILCSSHYQSFFSSGSQDADIRHFLDHETTRQERLFRTMEMNLPQDIYDLHFKRLQFCDDLSLYICAQQPGVAKEDELPWFKDGFRQHFEFAPDGMIAHWKDESTVSVDPFPFERPIEVSIPYCQLAVDDIESKGLQTAWDEAEVEYRHIAFVRPGE
ncbi:DUF3891 family protein [Thalassobacillus sp. CUG 92003]|uniref:DUF3891 family protein n=1 Tax=Thalassobacillus sp. CUG 92003 TaxID=2736641 RepID=UPI0015E748C5|nr:DUF3891 family protein [Thalassobacillus sp. CUG 92003]